MELVQECTFHADIAQPLIVGDSPAGTRMIVPVSPRLDVIGADGLGRLEVRTQLITDDGAVLYLTYTGLLEMNQDVQDAVAGGSTEFGDQYFPSTPRFETGDPRYGWVNTTPFVGEGRVVPGGVEYEIYRVS